MFNSIWRSRIGKVYPAPNPAAKVTITHNNFTPPSEAKPAHKPLGHVMIDIETLGVNPGCVILSVAAVEFDLKTGEVGRKFHKKIHLLSSEECGLKVEAQTLGWWMKQPPIDKWMEGDDLPEVMGQFIDFIWEVGGKEVIVWANSPTFDVAIIKHALALFKFKAPWPHTNERDVRTLASLIPEIKTYTPFEGDRHNALHDCLHQIRYCHNIYKKLGL